MKVDLRFNCPKSWDSMEGNDQNRHCSRCDKKVHNVAELSLDVAHGLIGTGNSCVTMRVNQRGEIKTASGFSKSLLLMGLAIGCGDPTIEVKKTPIATTGNDSKIEELEVIGGVVESHQELNPTVEDCESTTTKSTTSTTVPRVKTIEPKTLERHLTGRVAAPRHVSEKKVIKDKGKKKEKSSSKKEPPTTN